MLPKHDLITGYQNMEIRPMLRKARAKAGIPENHLGARYDVAANKITAIEHHKRTSGDIPPLNYIEEMVGILHGMDRTGFKRAILAQRIFRNNAFQRQVIDVVEHFQPGFVVERILMKADNQALRERRGSINLGEVARRDALHVVNAIRQYRDDRNIPRNGILSHALGGNASAELVEVEKSLPLDMRVSQGIALEVDHIKALVIMADDWADNRHCVRRVLERVIAHSMLHTGSSTRSRQSEQCLAVVEGLVNIDIIREMAKMVTRTFYENGRSFPSDEEDDQAPDVHEHLYTDIQDHSISATVGELQRDEITRLRLSLKAHQTLVPQHSQLAIQDANMQFSKLYYEQLLSPATAKKLCWSNITIAELKKMHDEDILSLRGIGPKALEEIRQFLAKLSEWEKR